MEIISEKEQSRILKEFMQEHFPFSEFKKIGVFTKEMKGDYKAQAQRICDRLALKSIYEYRSEEIKCHISYENRPLSVNKNGNLLTEPFVTVVPSIWD